MLENFDQELIEQAYRIAIQDTYKNSLYLLAKSLLGYKDVTRNTHGPIITALEDATKRKLICVPRGCLKSTVACVSYPIWLLIRNPNLRILIDSELYTNSKTFLREIKSQMESEKMTKLFGQFKSDDTWNESEIIIKQRTTPKKEASISVGGVGTTKVGQHYDVIIGDDYNSNKNSLTKEGCQKVISHFQYNTSILEPDGIYVVIGTRYSELDLIGWILENEIGVNRGSNNEGFHDGSHQIINRPISNS